MRLKCYRALNMLLYSIIVNSLTVGSEGITLKVIPNTGAYATYNVKFDAKVFEHFANCLCNKMTESCSVTYNNINGLKALHIVGKPGNNISMLQHSSFKCTTNQSSSSIVCERSTNLNNPCLPKSLCQSISLLSPLTCDAGCIGFLWTSKRESLEHNTGIQPCAPDLNGTTPKTSTTKRTASHTTAWPTTVTTKPVTLTTTMQTDKTTTTSITSKNLSATARGNVTNNKQTQQTDDKDDNTTVIISVTVTAIIIIALIIIVVLVRRWRKHHKHAQNDKTTSSELVPTPQSPYNLNGFSSNGVVNDNTGYINQINTQTNVQHTNPYEYASTDPERFDNFTSNPHTMEVDDDNNNASIDDNLIDNDFGYSTVNKLGTVKADTHQVYTKLGDKVKNITDPYDALLDPSEIPSPGQSSDNTSFQQVEQDLRREQMSEEETNKEAAEPEYSVVMKKGRRPK